MRIVATLPSQNPQVAQQQPRASSFSLALALAPAKSPALAGSSSTTLPIELYLKKIYILTLFITDILFFVMNSFEQLHICVFQ